MNVIQSRTRVIKGMMLIIGRVLLTRNLNHLFHQTYSTALIHNILPFVSDSALIPPC
jgi:hypothetical protein